MEMTEMIQVCLLTPFEPKVGKGEITESQQIAQDFSFQKISYDKLEPGDIVCTYETTTTIPTILKAIRFQKLISPKKREPYHKFLHFEIITEKQERKGFYKIAHASGMKRKVVEEVENLKNYTSGKALVVFRPKNSIIVKEMIDVARKIAEKGNPWGIRLMEDKSIKKILKDLWKSYRFEQTTNIHDKDIERAARMAVEFSQKGGIKNKSEALEMFNCAQFTASVINISVIKTIWNTIIEDEKLTTIKKKEKLIKDLKKLRMRDPESMAPPLKFSNPAVTASSFIEYLLSNPKDFEQVGYIGSFDDESKQKKLLIDRNSIKSVNMHDLNLMIKEIFDLNSKLEGVKILDEFKILEIFKDLKLINTSNYVHLNNVRNDAKLRTSFCTIYGQACGVSSQTLTDYMINRDKLDNIKNEYNKISEIFPELTEKDKDSYYEKFGKKYKINKKSIVEFLTTDEGIFNEVDKKFKKFIAEWKIIAKSANQPLEIKKKTEKLKTIQEIEEPSTKKPKLPEKQPLELLDIEKQFIKKNIKNISNNERSRQLSINLLEKEIVKSRNKRELGKHLFRVGIASLVILPFGLLLLSIATALKYSASKEINFFIDWQSRINRAYKKEMPNAVLKLDTKLEDGERPWVTYSKDDKGSEWDVEPLHLKDGAKDKWKVELKINKGLQYKLFIGPDDINDANPLGKVKKWQETSDDKNVVVESNQLGKHLNGLFVIPKCTEPNWIDL